MGTVYRAIDETLDRDVAIKILNPEFADSDVDETLPRGSEHAGEAQSSGDRHHLRARSDEDLLMVMEFVPGESLDQFVQRNGPVTERAAYLWLRYSTAIGHAHAAASSTAISSRPSDGHRAGAVKIMDFGIARVRGAEHMTTDGYMMGTPAYMSPEQVLGQEVDARSDLYSVGVMFYRLMTGKLPFQAETPFAIAQSQFNDPPTPIGSSDRICLCGRIGAGTRAREGTGGALPVGRRVCTRSISRCLAGLPMTTLYNPSAPTELLTTPARAIPMPTGALSQTGGFGTVGSPVPPPVRTPLPGTAQIGYGIPPTAVTPAPTESRRAPDGDTRSADRRCRDAAAFVD